MDVNTQTIVPVTDIAKIISGGIGTSLKSLLSSLASILKVLLSAVGITLPPQGYIIVALSVLIAFIYYMNKMTVELLKALVIGVVLAIVLHMLGVI